MVLSQQLSLVLLLAAPLAAQTPARAAGSTQIAAAGCCCDARTPVQSVPGNSNWRHVITEPGSYYLTGNVLGGQNVGAIRVDASDVTIDFNGFALIGTAPGSLSSVSSSYDDVTLRGGGVIRGWSSGLFLAGERCRVEDLTVLGSLTNGVLMEGADGSVERCAVAGHAWEGIHLAAGAGGTTVRDCRLRGNGRHQILVESDGNAIERCSVVAEEGVTQPAVTVAGAANRLWQNTVISGAVGEQAVEIAGDGNRLLETSVRLTASAVFGQGVAVTGTANEMRGGGVTVEPILATAVRFDEPFAVAAVLVALRPSAEDSTGILANAPGYIEQGNLVVGSPDSVGVDVQGGAANVGTALVGSRIRVTGAGSTAVRSLASASIVQGNGIVLEAAATGALTVDVGGGPGGHHVSENHMLLAGSSQGPVLNGTGDLVDRNEILVLGPGSTAISKVSGTAGMIRDNRIRLADPSATGIFVSEFLGELVSHNVVLGDGNQFDVGEGNVLSQILANPGFDFVAEDAVNLQIGN